MSRSETLLFVVILLFFLVACSGDSADNRTFNCSATFTEEITIDEFNQLIEEGSEPDINQFNDDDQTVTINVCNTEESDDDSVEVSSSISNSNDANASAD